MATFGNSAAPTADYPMSADRWVGSKFTLTEAADVTKVTGRFGSGSGTGDNMKAVIYADAAGSPGARMGVSAAAAGAAANTDVDFTLVVSLTAGDYWLGIVDDGGSAARLGNIAGSGSGRKEGLTYASPADPMGALDDAAVAFTFCVYATYTAAGGAPNMIFYLQA